MHLLKACISVARRAISLSIYDDIRISKPHYHRESACISTVSIVKFHSIFKGTTILGL
jgi:hypothetical protein